MPTLRGIKMDIISQWELKIHPEFPHPESLHKGSWDSSSQASLAVEYDEVFEDRISGESSDQKSISVYVPSLPGARFWIRWNIGQPAVDLSDWYFFKLFLNGRHITSWGTNSYKHPTGQVMRGLFEPSDRWNYKHAGTIYKNMGTESRPFIFAQESDDTSAAGDGGVMEIRAFRALGRQRRIPEPTDFKTQEGYGIAMPSGGLLDKPQDSKFFRWHLKDAKDDPFATIKFHYRSWKSLHALSLVPEDYPRALLSPNTSVVPLVENTCDPKSYPDDDEEDVVDEHEGDDGVKGYGHDEVECWADDDETSIPIEETSGRDSCASAVSHTPWLTGVFDDSPPTTVERERRSSIGLQYDTAPISLDPKKVDLISNFAAAASTSSANKFGNVPKGVKKELSLDRSLPYIPRRTSSINMSHSRFPSNVSIAQSITPSLWSYVDRSESSSPEPFISTAQAMAFPKPIFAGNAGVIDLTVTQFSPKTYSREISPPVTSPEQSPAAVVHKSPAETTRLIEITPPIRTSSAKHNPKPLDKSPSLDILQSHGANITVRKHKRSPVNLLARLSISGTPFKYGSAFRSNSFSKNADTEDSAQGQAISRDSTSLGSAISESEWMTRTPSPQKDFVSTRCENLWSLSSGDDGNYRSHHELETTSMADRVQSGSPIISSGNSHNREPRQDVEFGVGKSRYNLTQKALGWLENVNPGQADGDDEDIRRVCRDNQYDVKMRHGWI